jgi:hypothetical protein
MFKRWRSWIRVQLHRTANVHCLLHPPTEYMKMPPANEPIHTMDDLLSQLDERVARATVDVYACGGCRFGHP